MFSLNSKLPRNRKPETHRGSALITGLAAMALFVSASGNALAGGRTMIKDFYSFLSNPGSEVHADKFRSITSPDWESIGGYSGASKNREQLIGQMAGFAKLIPDLNWEIVEMMRKGKRVVVRGRATGTPVGPLFGVDGKGKSFDIMSIDIHTIEDGKIIRSYHIEDWAGAMRQLGAK